MLKVMIKVGDHRIDLTVPTDAQIDVVRDDQRLRLPVQTVEPHMPSRLAGDWEEAVGASPYADVENSFCRGAEERGWRVERAKSASHPNDINIYPPIGFKPVVRLCAFNAQSGRVHFQHRVTERDARTDVDLNPVRNNAGTPREEFDGLRIRLRDPADVDAALELAAKVFERLSE